MATILDNDCKMAFAVPGDDSIVDMINPATGRSYIEGETLEQIRLRYPKAEIVSLDDFCKAKADRQHTPITWSEITDDQYEYWLECLPPAAWIGDAFMVGEPYDHDAETGGARFQACNIIDGKCLASSRPMTRKEFKEMFGGAK